MAFQRFISVSGTSLILLGCAACVVPPTEESELLDTVWQLQQIQYNNDTSTTVDSPQNYTVQFLGDGTVAVQADCNRGQGPFTTTEDRQITIGPLATTSAACGPDSIDGEFVQRLSDAAIYFLKDGDLFLDLRADAGTMQFSATADLTELTGQVWQLREIRYNDGKSLTAEPPENYTLEFLEDGSIVAKADCNQAIGSFSITDGREIMIGPLATTSAACPPESIGDDYVQGLNNAAIYFFQDGDLFLDIRYDTGTMRFVPADS